jgi:hypothetical protein
MAIAYNNKKDLTNAITELKTATRLAPDWLPPHLMLYKMLKDSDPKSALDECVIADGLSNDAKLHDQCFQLQKKTQ